MPMYQPKYSKEETGKRGNALYQERIRSLVEEGNLGQVVAIDVDSGAYAIGENALDASHLLRENFPHAEIWLERVGYRSLHRFGMIRSKVTG